MGKLAQDYIGISDEEMEDVTEDAIEELESSSLCVNSPLGDFQTDHNPAIPRLPQSNSFQHSVYSFASDN